MMKKIILTEEDARVALENHKNGNVNNIKHIVRRKIEGFDKEFVLQHELGHFICFLRSAMKYDKSELKRLFKKGSINVVNDGMGFFTCTAKKKNMKEENIMLNTLVGGMFFRLFYDRKNNETHPEKIRKSTIDKECYYGGGHSDMEKAIEFFGEEKSYRAFRRMREWIGPDDILFFNQCYEYCMNVVNSDKKKKKIMVKYLIPFAKEHYNGMREFDETCL